MFSETVLITGASSGIGFELAKLFARDGFDLVVIARREDRLIEIKKNLELNYRVSVKVIAKDLSLQNSAKEIFDELEAENIEIDILVNNAGFGAVGKVCDIDYETQRDMINLNIGSLFSLTRLFLPNMVQRNTGGILNVGSLAGFQPGPNAGVYYATKAFVLSFTEALYEELKGTNIKVSCLAPGPTKTEFAELSGLDRSTLFNFAGNDSDKVALDGFEGLMYEKAVVIPGLLNKIVPILIRFTPRCIVRKISSFLNKPR